MVTESVLNAGDETGGCEAEVGRRETGWRQAGGLFMGHLLAICILFSCFLGGLLSGDCSTTPGIALGGASTS